MTLNQAKYYNKKWHEFNINHVCTIAAENGWLDLLIWARNKSYHWDEWTAIAAAKYGNLELYKYIVNNGCPLNVGVTTYAANAGHIEIIKWAIKNECPFSEYLCKCAKEHDTKQHNEILEWILTNGCKCGGIYH